MGYLKALYDQLIKAHLIAKRLCKDESFIHLLGLNALPPSARVPQLKVRVGFVLSFYDNFRLQLLQEPKLSVDENLTKALDFRLSTMRNLNPTPTAEDVIRDFQSNKEWWKKQTTEGKFTVLCSAAMNAEEANIRGSVVDSTVPYLIATRVIQECMLDFRH